LSTDLSTQKNKTSTIFTFVGLTHPKLKHLPGLKEAPLLVFLALAL